MNPVIIGDATLYLGRMEDILPTLGRVDACVTDPPYGITENRWDHPAGWGDFWRIKAPVFVFTASQPFTSSAVFSKKDWFRHEWIWIKNAGSNFANTVREPMKEHESVLVFAPGKWTYNKQMQERTGGGAERVKTPVKFETGSDNYRQFERVETKTMPELRVPSSWQKFNRERGLHPTQKPVALFDYLIRTYSDQGNTILDPFMGSGTTGVACAKLGRKFIGIEIEPKYFDIACKRIEAAYAQPAKPVQEQML